MASLITVRLNKGDSPNWGFRLQGGKDFGTPLVIQKVNGGSPAERAGLIAGDSVIKINTTDVFNLRHKDAQDVVIRAGPAFEMTIQRGGSTWKPAVQPVGSYSTPTPSINNISPVTKTSLTAPKGENIGAIGTGHNVSAKPFNAQVNGAVNGGPRLVNKQYNSPLKLYSEESIAETLSAQTEVLSTGALGVNFKKNEKNYDATNSAVYRMLQEAEREPKTPEEPDAVTNSVPIIGGLRHVQAPETKPASNPSTQQLPPGQNICADCERLIVGVFVRIKDKNLHVECFKCSTCGSSLKNVGYYNINNKLYCDIHAKLAARTNPPAPNLVPVTVPPGGKIPAGTISAALQSHSLPSPSPLSPKSSFGAAPYQQEETKEAISSSLNLNEPNNNKLNSNFYSCSTPIPYSKYLKASGNFSTPKPFSSVSAPISPASTLPRTAPLSPVVPAPAPVSAPFSPAPSTGSYSSVKPAGPREHDLVCEMSNLQMNLPPPPPPVPLYNPINITIPYSSTPLDSKGSSPRSDYSSTSSTGTKNQHSLDLARENILAELKNLQQPRLRKTDNSVPHLPKMELFVKDKLKDDHEEVEKIIKQTLPDNLTFANNNKPDRNQSETTTVAFNNSVTQNINDECRKTNKEPICNVCNVQITRGPFITALGRIWCPDHFICATPSCRRPLQDLGFVEEQGQLYCEYCFEQYLAPPCAKCSAKIKGDCLKAIGKNFHPECFTCAYCNKLFGNSPFFLEDGSPYCEADWNELFTTKCFACGFPVEAGDRWVEALNNNYHSQCFNCTMCKKNLEGQSFFAKGGRPFCKNHAR